MTAFSVGGAVDNRSSSDPLARCATHSLTPTMGAIPHAAVQFVRLHCMWWDSDKQTRMARYPVLMASGLVVLPAQLLPSRVMEMFRTPVDAKSIDAHAIGKADHVGHFSSWVRR